MKRLFFSFGFLFPLALLLLHQLLQRVLMLPLPFFDAYLDPFCLGALIFYPLLWEHQLLWGKSTFSILEILITLLLLIAITEGLFPYLSEAFTRDAYDAIALALGAGWFCLLSGKVRLGK